MEEKEILEKIERQRETLKSNPLALPKNRIHYLKLLKNNIETLTPEICAALKKDLNKSETESYMCEIGLVLSELNYMIKHCKRFAKEKRVHTPLAQFPAKSYKKPCPFGVVLIVSPWNYPFMLTIEPLVDAIAAGNLAVLKPSTQSEQTSSVIEKLINMTFPDEIVHTVLGSRENAAFLLEQDFDYIFYTGSPKMGSMVLEKAAKHFTPVTLELGGKSPCIVDESANISLAAKRIVFGKFLNCGQTCVAPDYILCHESVKETLIEELKRQIVLQYSTSPLSNEDYPKIINSRHFETLKTLLEKENVIFGGNYNEENLQIEPTLVDANKDSPSMEEEIFGPILPVLTYKNLDDVVEYVNSHNKPLALYLFSSNKQNHAKITQNCQYGGGCINDTIIHLATPNLGFGGLKQSGIGAYHGKAGFDTFTHYKSIVKKRTWLDLPMRYQPYNKFKAFLIKMFLK